MCCVLRGAGRGGGAGAAFLPRFLHGHSLFDIHIQVRSGFQVQCTGRISGRFDIHVAG